MRPDNLLVFIELEALITERAGMEAENQRRLDQGYALAYDDSAFGCLASRIRDLKEKVKAEPPEGRKG